MRRKLWALFFTLFLLPLAAAAYILYFYLPQSTSTFLKRSLEAAGLIDVYVVTESAKKNSALFTEIRFRAPIKPEGEIFVRGKKVEVLYSLRALIRGNAEEIKIGELDITISLPISTKSKPFSYNWPGLKIPKLPISKAYVNRLNLAHGNSLNLSFEKIELDLNPRDLGANLELLSPIREFPFLQKPISLGNQKIQTLKLLLPDRIKIESKLKLDENSRISALSMKRIEGVQLLALAAKNKTFSRVNISVNDMQANPKYAGFKLLVSESRGKWRIPLDVTLTNSNSDIGLSGSYRLQPQKFSNTSKLSSWLEIWPFSFEVNGGELKLDGSFTANVNTKTVNHQWKASVSGLNGQYGKIELEGLNINCVGQDSLGKKFRWRSSCAKIYASRLLAGIAIEKISFGATAESHPVMPKLSFTRFEVQAFGGKIWAEPFIWDGTSKNNLATLKLSELNLQEVLQSKSDAEFHAEGRLNGTLPLRINGFNPTIESGKIEAVGGGLLQYRPKNSAAINQTNPSLGMALSALDNFRYTLLQSKVDYDSKGIMRLAIELQGRNPGFQNGKPVHFNINLEENLLALLKSLNVADDFGREIDKRVQKR